MVVSEKSSISNPQALVKYRSKYWGYLFEDGPWLIHLVVCGNVQIVCGCIGGIFRVSILHLFCDQEQNQSGDPIVLMSDKITLSAKTKCERFGVHPADLVFPAPFCPMSMTLMLFCRTRTGSANKAVKYSETALSPF